MLGGVEVFYNNGDNKCRVHVQDDEILDGDYDTKNETVEAAREEARTRGVELYIKNQSGTISEKDSLGNDPFSIPG